MSGSKIRRRPLGQAHRFAEPLHPVLKRVYAARGLTCSADLDLSLERLLPITSLPGVESAAALLAAHRTDGRVLVIGDFDADGATSTALVVRALRSMHFAHVDFLVPNRFRFGYGLTPEIVALAATRQPSLIVTVDNGVSSVAGVEAARSLGIPVLVTDHHLPGAELPRAEVMVNPNLPGSSFASSALAGVGVAFYVVAALSKMLGSDFRATELLDLVALGTVADVVPLDRNNRILVAQGLRRIRAGRCVPGIRALLESANRRFEQITAADLGFAVAPRLNAAGRLTDMSLGIACLLADESADADRLAGQLTQLNEERRTIEQRMQTEAVSIAGAMRVDADGHESPGLCLFDESWHQGVVGLVAGRIKDRLHRPVIAFARPEGGGSLRGSARSVSGINIRDALDAIATRYPQLIEKFGGHAMAAGLSLSEENLAAFKSAFAAEIGARSDREILTGLIHTDGELSDDELSLDTARVLRGAGPWGQGFPEPVFDGRFEIVDVRVVGGKHLKMQIRSGPGLAARTIPWSGASSAGQDGLIDAIAFGYVGGPAEVGRIRQGVSLQLAYRLEINEYRGVERAQLNCQYVGEP